MRDYYVINFRGVDLDVYGTYIEPEASVYNYGDGSGYPGSSSDFEIEKICLSADLSETNVSELLDEYLDKIKEEVLNKIEL